MIRDKLIKECYLCGSLEAILNCSVCNLPVCSDCFVTVNDEIYCKDQFCKIQAKNYLDELLES